MWFRHYRHNGNLPKHVRTLPEDPGFQEGEGELRLMQFGRVLL